MPARRANGVQRSGSVVRLGCRSQMGVILITAFPNSLLQNSSLQGCGGRREVAVCWKSQTLGKYQPSCVLAHNLLNKLSVIVGCCDLLKAEVPENATCEVRLRAIRRIAQQMAEYLGKHRCQMEVLSREAAQSATMSVVTSSAAKKV
jgi:hypothetical protein